MSVSPFAGGRGHRQTLSAFELPAPLWSPQSGGAPPFTVKIQVVLFVQPRFPGLF